MRIQRQTLVGGLAALLLAALAAGCGGSSSSSSSSGGGSKVLVGAGSTLVYPLISQWVGDYSKKKDVTITYGPIGSGGGIAQVTARSVDFGASDAPLTADQQQAAKGVVMIPWALAGTLVAYHVEGVHSKLRLTGAVVSDIYLGKVTTWNATAIARLNPGVDLPDTRIVPIYRSDGSGDTYAFTDFLSHVSPAWKSKVGTATQVNFPTGTGGKGNSGVAASLTQTNGGIAYIGIAHVKESHLDYALLQNRAGKYPDPTPATIAAAAAGVKSLPADNAVSIVDPPASAAGAYPLSTFTYALIPADSPKLAALKQLLRYAITDGQKFAGALSFAPLPGPIVAADRKAIGSI